MCRSCTSASTIGFSTWPGPVHGDSDCERVLPGVGGPPVHRARSILGPMVERVLWRIAVGCAALLLCAPITPRTSWTGEGGASNTHSAGWDWIALLLGIVALVSLIVGRRQRPAVAGAVFGAMIASISLAVAGAAALGHWLDLMSGSLNLNEPRWVIHPAPAVGYFAAIAIVGMVATLVLLGSWLHPGDAEPRP